MADSELPEPISRFGGQLKRLAEEDCEDEKLIADARKRIKLRDIERDSLRSTFTTKCNALFDSFSKQDAKATGGDVQEAFINVEPTKVNLVDFETMLSEFEQMCLHMDAEEILTCPLCYEYPDDPIVTPCFCLYCTECFTELLAKSNKSNYPPSCQRGVCANEKITDYLILTNGQWRALLELWNIQVEDFDISQELGPGWGMHTCQEKAGDIELLWALRSFAESTPSLSGDNRLSSPNAGETTMDLSLRVPTCELSTDGFGEDSDRSYAYEQDSGVDEGSDLQVTLQGVYSIDPRFQTSSGDLLVAETRKACLNKVPWSEVKDLAETASSTMHTAPYEQGIHADDNELRSVIDLTGNVDGGHDAASTMGKGNGSNVDGTEKDTEEAAEEEEEENDEDDEDDKTSCCSCEDCAGAKQGLSPA